MEKWEYKSLICYATNIETALAPLGEQGWEVVGVAPAGNVPVKTVIDRYTEIIHTVTEWSASTYCILLKRRKP